jgi:predicted amino acid dehydrogenase
MKEILCLTMSSAVNNQDTCTEILGAAVRVKELGVDHNIHLLKDLIKKYRGQVDVMTISGLPNPFNVNGIEITHPLLNELKHLAQPTPLVDGTNIRNILVPWSLNYFLKEDPSFLKNKKIGFFTGAIQHYLINDLVTHGAKPYFADIYFLTNIPKLIKSTKRLEQFILKGEYFIGKKSLGSLRNRDFNKSYLKQVPGFKEFFNCDIFVLNSTQLDYITLPDLTGKSVIIESITPKVSRILKEKNVAKIYQSSANIQNKVFSGFTKLEALFQVLKEESSPLTKNEVEEYIQKLDLRPNAAVEVSKMQKEINRFAFIIHPLSKNDLLKIPVVKPFIKSQKALNSLEFLATKIPSFRYGTIKGIRSELTGQEAVGDIYAVTDTPKMMLKSSPNRMYKKLINITHDADKRGNQIIGLGAYTKVVGDAGVTVNKYSPIPVTTGNSLSACATLWAANYAVEKMGFAKKRNNQYESTVMIVGATGSIGKVNSKILAQVWQKVIIVAPKLYKLIDLKEEILEINPECDVVTATNPNDYLHECDLVITTTSARGKKVLDIEKVKPGCVICDVSRPFDISKEDAMTRPDIF